MLAILIAEKIFLSANQFEHKGPLKIENEKVELEEVNEEDDARVAEKHFIFSEQHEVFDIGPDVEVIN
uniref:Uncharacterized protein n=1 Tax=Elaeophora elaphi TaxID=1147741 RepID=A0A0R3RX62_9BILA